MKQKPPIYKNIIFDILTMPCIILILVSGIVFCAAIGVCYIFLFPVQKWFSAEDRSKIANSSYSFKILVIARDFFRKVISK